MKFYNVRKQFDESDDRPGQRHPDNLEYLKKVLAVYMTDAGEEMIRRDNRKEPIIFTHELAQVIRDISFCIDEMYLADLIDID